MKLFKFGLLLFVNLIAISLTSALQISVSTEYNSNNPVNVHFGTTINDLAGGHLQLNPGDGTLFTSISLSNGQPVWNNMVINDQRYHSANGFFDCTSCPFPYCAP